MSDLSTIKAGDEVALRSGAKAVTIVKVDRVTKLHAIIGNAKYRLRDGNPVGEWSWSAPSIHIPTDTDRALAHHQKLRRRLARYQLDALSSAQLEALLSVLEKPTDAPE